MSRLYVHAWAVTALAASCVAVPPPATDLPDSVASAAAEEAPWDPQFRYLDSEVEAIEPAMDGAMEHGDGPMQHVPDPSVDHGPPVEPSGSEPGAPPVGHGDAHTGHGMEQDHASSPPVEEETELSYLCSMHPEVVREDSGTCPICGRTLEPQPYPVSQGDGR